MAPFPPAGRTLWFLLTGLLAIALSGCEPATAPTTSATRSYVFNLSLANMAFNQSPEALPAARPYIQRMNTYAQEQARNGKLTAVVLAFKADGEKSSHRVLVPVAAYKGGYDLAPVRQMTASLAKYKPEYRNVRVRDVTVARRTAVPLSRRSKAEDVHTHVHELFENILSTVQELPAIEEAKVQLELTRLFMRRGVRDAAYLSLENATQLLADADTGTTEEKAEVETLSTELQTLENTLHKQLPYNF